MARTAESGLVSVVADAQSAKAIDRLGQEDADFTHVLIGAGAANAACELLAGALLPGLQVLSDRPDPVSAEDDGAAAADAE